MIDFENLKSSYISVVQWGLSARVGCEESKSGNEVLHKFCEDLIDNSNYNNSDKAMMKHELETIKEVLSEEIECFYQKMKI